MHSSLQDFTRVALGYPEPGTQSTGVACVRSRTEKQASTGAPYLVVNLGHRDGQATVKVWASEMPLWRDIAEGDAVWVRCVGKAGNGTYPPEWTVHEIRRLPADHPVRDDLLPQCPLSRDELHARFESLRAELTAPARALLEVVLRSVGVDAFWRAPAAERMHHAVAPLGLAWHSIEVAEVALAMARAIPTCVSTLSSDALILGALLHDLGKVREYDVVPGVGIRRSALAEARYHTTIGIEMVATAVAVHAAELAEAGVPAWLIDHVYAVIESHHGQKDWGSPSPPSSRESWLLHLADQTSAKLASMTATLERATPMDQPAWYRPADPRARPLQRFDLLTPTVAPTAPSTASPVDHAQDTGAVDDVIITLILEQE